MKKILLALAALSLAFFACSDSSASSGKENSLVLNANCKSFELDTSLWSEVRDASLDSVKAKIAECASLAISWDSAHRFFDWLMWNEGDEKDSVAIYLLENGMDSIAVEVDLMELAMYALDTNLVMYLFENGYPVTGPTIYRVLMYAFMPNFDVLAWYEKLVPYIPHVDSIKEPGMGTIPILHGLCYLPSLSYLKGDTLKMIATDIVARGADVNRLYGKEVPLHACRYKEDSQSGRQKMLEKIYIEGGADTTFAVR